MTLLERINCFCLKTFINWCLFAPQLIEDLRKQLEHLQLYKLEAEAKRGRSPGAGLQEYQTRTREAELEQEIKRLKQVARIFAFTSDRTTKHWIKGWFRIWPVFYDVLRLDLTSPGQPQPERAERRVKRADYQPEHPGSQELDVGFFLRLPGSRDQLCVSYRGRFKKTGKKPWNLLFEFKCYSVVAFISTDFSLSVSSWWRLSTNRRRSTTDSRTTLTKLS